MHLATVLLVSPPRQLLRLPAEFGIGKHRWGVGRETGFGEDLVGERRDSVITHGRSGAEGGISYEYRKGEVG